MKSLNYLPFVLLLATSPMTMIGAQEKEKQVEPAPTAQTSEQDTKKLVAAVAQHPELFNEKDLKKISPLCGKISFRSYKISRIHSAREIAQWGYWHFGKLDDFTRGTNVLIPQNPQDPETPLINAVYLQLHKNTSLHIVQTATDKTVDVTKNDIGIWNNHWPLQY